MISSPEVLLFRGEGGISFADHLLSRSHNTKGIHAARDCFFNFLSLFESRAFNAAGN